MKNSVSAKVGNIRKTSSGTAKALVAALLCATSSFAINIPEYSHKNPKEIRISGTAYVERPYIVNTLADDPIYGPAGSIYSGVGYVAWFYWQAPVDGILELDTHGSKFDKIPVGQVIGRPLDTLLCACVNSSDEYSRVLDEANYSLLGDNDNDPDANDGSSALSIEVFQGWQVFIGIGARNVSDDTDIYLNYKYKPKVALVRFNPQGGSLTRASLSVYEGDEALNTRGEFPTSVRGGYNFEGWFTEPQGGVKITGDESPDSVAKYLQEGVLNVYAQWSLSGTGVTPQLDPAFNKTQRVSGAFLTHDGALVGSVEIQVTKKSKKNIAKVSLRITRYDTVKKIGGKGTLTFTDDGSAVSDPIKITFKDSKFKDDTLNMAVRSDGTFLLSGSVYKLVASQVGGALISKSLVFSTNMGAVNNWPTIPAGYQLVRDALPEGFNFQVTNQGRKFEFPKGKVLKYVKAKDPEGNTCYVLDVDEKSNPNMSLLKLAYQDKTGIFKGYFTIYATNGELISYTKPKMKKAKIQVVGLVINGKGWGNALMKASGESWIVQLDP